MLKTKEFMVRLCSPQVKKYWKEGLIVILIISLLVLGSVIYFQKRRTAGTAKNQTSEVRREEKKNSVYNPDITDLTQTFGRESGCKGRETKMFGALPMKLEDIATYVPYGLVVGDHVTPIDHSYFYPKEFNSARDAYPVFAPADGTIVAVSHRGDGKRTGHANRVIDEYQMQIEYSCGFYSYFDLLTSISPELEAVTGKLVGDSGRWYGRFPVKEGQEIGRIGGQTVDFAVYKYDVTKNFVNPESYKSESWKIHIDNPFKYFKEPLRSQLIAKNIRKAEPIEGKIDYDIDGKLSGSWFLEGTNGYGGAGNNFNSYTGHLSFVYDHIDPTALIVSIGEYTGRPAQFGIKGNGPDFATIGQSSGLVKYELAQVVHYDKDTGKMWNMIEPIANPGAKPNEYVQGTILVQLLENRKIKFEAFPNKTSNQVNGFTQDAKIYVR